MPSLPVVTGTLEFIPYTFRQQRYFLQLAGGKVERQPEQFLNAIIVFVNVMESWDTGRQAHLSDHGRVVELPHPHIASLVQASIDGTFRVSVPKMYDDKLEIYRRSLRAKSRQELLFSIYDYYILVVRKMWRNNNAELRGYTDKGTEKLILRIKNT